MSYENPNVFTGGYLMEMQKAKSDLNDVQEREKEITDLEKQIREMNGLFKEMHMLVTEQGEQLNNNRSQCEPSWRACWESKAEFQTSRSLSEEITKKVYYNIDHYSCGAPHSDSDCTETCECHIDVTLHKTEIIMSDSFTQ